MCQLTFINLHDPKLNKLYLMSQAFANTIKDHRDGFGFFYPPDTLKKTAIAPFNCINLGKFIEIDNSNPIIAHVRKATAYGTFREVSDKKSHPFKLDNLILAHNGTLELNYNSEYYLEKFDGKIDTEVFLEILSRVYKLNPDLPEALIKAYEHFTGKFAFMIHDGKDFYIVRGNTADLHFLEIKDENKKVIGFVVNTDKESLVSGLLLFRNYLQFTGGNIHWNSEEIKELEKNSIFKVVGDSLEKVGTIEEKAKEIRSTVTTYGGGYANRNLPLVNNLIDVSKSKNIKDLWEDPLVKDLNSLLTSWQISLEYLDEIIYNTLGIPLVACNREHLVFFMNEIVSRISTSVLDKTIFPTWKKARTEHMFYDIFVHDDKNNLQFPYMLVKKSSELDSAIKGK